MNGSKPWTPRPLPGRAPGKAMRNGEAICPCAGWVREGKDCADMLAGRDIDHAVLCDGHGNPTRGLTRP